MASLPIFTPDSTVRILQGINIDKNYKHTMDFSNASTQANFFIGKTFSYYTNCVPIQNRELTFRVRSTPNQFDTCNYIMWQNRVGERWYYGWIENLTYPTLNSCEINVVLDYLQTYMFDMRPAMCNVVRQHVAKGDDRLYSYITPESKCIGEYVSGSTYRVEDLVGDYTAVLQAGAYLGGTSVSQGRVSRGLYTGLTTYAYEIIRNGVAQQSGIDAMNSVIQDYIDNNQVDSIAATYIIPSYFADLGNVGNNTITRLQYSIPKLTILSPGINNNKCNQYPYNYLYAMSSSGDTHEYRYERWSGLDCTFEIICSSAPNPEVICVPTNYNGQDYNLSESISLTGFPQFAFAIDTFKAWVAQNGKSNDKRALMSGVSAAVSVASAPLTGGASLLGLQSSIGGVADTVIAEQEARNASEATSGGIGTSTLTASNNMNFYFINRKLTDDAIVRVDQQFDRQGYTIFWEQTPNLNNRSSWNYCLTDGAIVTGSAPEEAKRVYEQTLNNGLTVWHGDYIGDYGRSNI